MADEWVQATKSLWDGWEDGALTFDDASGTFADHTKVHRSDFEGEFYKTRGPLNVPPGPQRYPVFCQAGGSGAGMAFGAKHADTIIAQMNDAASAKEYRDEISRLAVSFGRDPSDIKVLFLTQPVLADTHEEAVAKNERNQELTDEKIQLILSGLSYTSGHDFSKYDLDSPAPDLTGKSNGHRSTTDTFSKNASGKTLREALTFRGAIGANFVGSPETVADQMEDWIDQGGGDGFLVALPVTRKNITEICDGLAPVLRRRGLMRDSYEHDTFRENLLAF
jgi:alkanesulfonate monooxygenase SsuD/methylene tetrahydromethanopterin reductase-like flavin-dependent oxidoreductase (luciferase family)